MLFGQEPSTALQWLSGSYQVANEFAGHLLLLAELMFVVGVVVLGLGKSLGLPYLFWHEDPSKQTIAGVASVLLASELAFMSYLLSPRNMAEEVTIQAYLLQGGAALLGLLVVLAAVARLAQKRGKSVRPKHRSFFVAGALIGVILTILLVLGGSRIERPLSTWACKELPTHVASRFPPGRCVEHLHLHVLAVLFVVALVAVYLAGALRKTGAPRKAEAPGEESARIERMWPSPAVGLCVALALVAAGYSFYEFWFRGMHPLIPLGVVALLLWLAGRDAYKLRFSTLAALYADGARVPLAGYERRAAGAPGSGGLLDLHSIPWANAQGPWAAGKRPLVLVCASGGGLRAAVWTTAVLGELERTLPGFPYHVRLVSGASGGMVGAAYWAATLRPPPEHLRAIGQELHAVSLRQMVKDVACESLSCVTHALVYRDLPFALLPWTNELDRGVALEEAFAENMPRGFSDKTLKDLREGEAEGWRPSLVFSPMLVEDGRRLLISNLDLEPLLVQSGPRIGEAGEAIYSHSGYELSRLFPESFKRFPLATAARISASFPYVTPSAILPTEPRRRVADAGYWDNYGVSLACGFLFESLKGDPAAPMRRWLEENVSGVLLVQIRDGVSTLSAEGEAKPAAPKRGERPRQELGSLARGIEWLTTPILGLFSARQGAMMFRNDEQVEAVGAMFAAKHGDGFFTTVTFSFDRQASLSWYLTEREKRLLSRQARLVVKARAEALERWWEEKRPRGQAG